MSQLFVANVTKQIVQFAYRLPERQGVIIQPIPIGGQIKISPTGGRDELSSPDIDAILDQHRKYGLISATEIDSSKTPFHGMCYSLDKPIPVEKLHRAMTRNEEALEDLGKAIRKEAAVAVNRQIEGTIGENLRQLEMSITEEEPRGGYPDTHDPLGEGIRVIREEEGGGLPFIGRSARRGRKNG
jgi:hypothetical protein